MFVKLSGISGFIKVSVFSWVSLCALVSQAAAPVFDTEDGKYAYTFPYYVVDAGEGATVTLKSDAVIMKYADAADEGSTVPYAEFLEETSGTFFKTGVGTLKIDAALPNWEGQIHVMAGRLESLDSFTLGKSLCKSGTRASSSDGTFVHKQAVIFRKHPNPLATVADDGTGDRKYIAIEGSGPDGLGAEILSSFGSAETTWPLGYDAALTGDALIRIESSGVIMKMSWSPSPGSKIWLNGHTLTITGQVANAGAGFMQNGGTVTEGHLLVKNACFQLYGTPVFVGGDTNTVTLTDCSIWRFSTSFNGANTLWTVNVDSALYGEPTAVTPYEPNKQDWKGPVNLNGDLPLRCWLSSGMGHGCMSFTGRLSGPGGFPMYRQQRNLELHLACPSNSFAGPVVLNEGSLHLDSDGALPPTCAGLTVTNGSLVMKSVGRTYELPQLTFVGTGGIFSASSDDVDGRAVKITKAGVGTLDDGVGLNAQEVDVREGTFRIGQLRIRNRLAGLTEGVLPGADSSAGAANEMRSTTLVTNAVKLKMDYALGMRQKFTCHMYYGYLWNREATNVNWTFFTYVTNGSVLRFDNRKDIKEVPGYQADGHPGFVTIRDVTPGPHWFEWRSYSSIGGDGYPANISSLPKEYTWKDGLPVAWDPLGRDEKDWHNFRLIEDPGDGSVMTVTDNLDELAASVYRWPSYDLMRFAPGTMLELSGQAFDVPDLVGCPTITSGDLTVTNSWTVDAAEVAAGAKLTAAGAFALADGAKIVVTESAKTRASPEGGWTLAEAEGGLTLPEDWRETTELPADGSYSLKLSADGKKLSLVHQKGLILLVR